MFRDREDAGKKLARKLKKYRGESVLVLAIPRGGTRVGFEVAEYLEAKFSLLVVRKLPYPRNSEAGFGAIAEDGSEVLLREPLPEKRIKIIEEEQREEIERRVRKLRGEPLPTLKDETVILVDDGIATGSTMKAAVEYCKNNCADEIVVASPVSKKEAEKEFEELVNEVYILETPDFFRAVAQVYENWHDVSDDEVLEIMSEWSRDRG